MNFATRTSFSLMCCFCVVFCIIGCSSERTQCPDGFFLSDEGECLTQPAPNDSVPEQTPAKAEELPPAKYYIDPAVEKVLSLHSKINSLQYFYNEGITDSHTYYLKGNRAKLQFPSPYRLDEVTVVTAIYVDHAMKTAQGVCTHQSRCPDYTQKKVFDLSYDMYGKYPTPFDHIGNIQSTVYVEDTEFDRRKSIVAEVTTTSRQKKRYVIDKTYGLVLRTTLLQDGKEVKENTYTQIVVNSVQDTDVTLSQS